VTRAAGPEAAFLPPGFADPARDAQQAYRAVLSAFAHPTRVFPLAGPAEPPAALGRGLAAVVLTLLDEACTVWLGGGLARDADERAWLAFHTGARRVDAVIAADFIITAPDTLPALASLPAGTDEAPHLSALVVIDIRGCAGPARFTAAGPGIDGTSTLAAPWAPAGFADAWRRNTASFPRGVDLLLVDEHTVTAVPRTTRLTATDPEMED
jgi:alpha-D-ribose 1-methylphosphonate 5-triphosphate synthase subunit PhnH